MVVYFTELDLRRGASSMDQAAVPGDYDHDPGRFAANQLATSLYSSAGDVHPTVAERLAGEDGVALVVDLGGGNGVLAGELAVRGVQAVVVDRARGVRQARWPAVRADLRELPFASGCFDAAACLWVLYHLDDPRAALREAVRVVREGGWFVAATSSRVNDPELADVLPGWGRRSTFDAEDAPDLVGEIFGEVEVTSWDAPLVRLPDRAAVELFLRGRGLDEAAARQAATGLRPPLDVTKRGALVWARRS